MSDLFIGSTPLAIPKQEEFIRICALTGRKPYEVYLEVYATKNKANARKRAWELMQKPEVKARYDWYVNLAATEEVKNLTADRTWVEREMLLLYQMCVKTNDRTNARHCLQLIGMDMGMYVQRKAVLHGKIDPLSGSAEDVQQRVAGLIARAFPGADPGVVLEYLGAGSAEERARLLAGSPGSSGSGGDAGEASTPEALALSALPEAARVPSGGSDLSEALPDGSEPSGEDAGSGERNGRPPHRYLS